MMLGELRSYRLLNLKSERMSFDARFHKLNHSGHRDFYESSNGLIVENRYHEVGIVNTSESKKKNILEQLLIMPHRAV